MTPPDSPVRPAVGPSLPAWERWAVGLVLALFVVVGLNHLRPPAHFGQDFALHSRSTEELIADPGKWFPQDFTNRPLLYWIGAVAPALWGFAVVLCAAIDEWRPRAGGLGAVLAAVAAIQILRQIGSLWY